MRFSSVLVSVGCMCLVGCVQSSKDVPVLGGTNAAAAEALTHSVNFSGGTLSSGELPAANATDVSLISPENQTALPGEVSLLSIDITNPDQQNPVVLTLLQFDDSDQHIEVPTVVGKPDASVDMDDAGVVTKSHVELQYMVDATVCNNLCNKRFKLTLVQAVKLEDGKVSSHTSTTIELDCSEKGNRKYCATSTTKDAGQSGTGGTAGSSGTGGTAGGGARDAGTASATFQCATGEVITKKQLCDGKQDCKDNGDETNICHACSSGNQQYSDYAKCDQVMDCSDGSDEANCNK